MILGQTAAGQLDKMARVLADAGGYGVGYLRGGMQLPTELASFG